MLKQLLQGRFMNHPLHPFLVHLPVGLWIASLIFDIGFKVNGNTNFAVTSFYCLLFGLIGALLAVPAGLADYVDIPENTMPKRIATTHFMMNGGIIILVAINLFLRYRLQFGVPGYITVPQLALSVFTIIALSVSGYLGGLLVYRYGIGSRRESDQDRPGLKRVA